MRMSSGGRLAVVVVTVFGILASTAVVLCIDDVQHSVAALRCRCAGSVAGERPLRVVDQGVLPAEAFLRDDGQD